MQMHRTPVTHLGVRLALGFVVLSVLIATAGLARVQAQRKPTDNPFLPSGNPFDVIRDGINTVVGKLDTITKKLDRIAPELPPGQVTLYTGLIRRPQFGRQDLRCSMANVGTERIQNAEIRIMTDHGFVSDRFILTRGLDSGDSVSVGPPQQFSGTYRCEFEFDGSPDAVRATINLWELDGGETASLDAR
jgi:hypothetical protein